MIFQVVINLSLLKCRFKRIEHGKISELYQIETHKKMPEILFVKRSQNYTPLFLTNNFYLLFYKI